MLGKTDIPMKCQMFGFCLQIILCYFFVLYYDFEIKGVSYASIITNVSMFLVLQMMSLQVPDIRKHAHWPNRKSFTGIKKYLSVGLPSAMMVCLEWWSSEIILVISGILGVNYLASQVILVNIFEVLYLVFAGIAQVSGSKMGQ